MKNRVLLLILTLAFPLSLISQGNGINSQEFISTYKQIAIEEMNLHGIPASIKMAQAILESGFGNSDLARNASNFFGIKCNGWKGLTYLKDDDKPNECFRAYGNPEESFRDHSQFLRTRPWYSPLFQLALTDYKGWATGLQRAGYATNPNYSALLVRIIEGHNLHELDKMPDPDRAGQQTPMTLTTPEAEHIVKEIEPNPQGISHSFEVVDRKVEVNNRIKYVIARAGDTPEIIGREFNKQARHIKEYNELGDDRKIAHGQIIYLQPKRNRGERAFHIIQSGETLYDISQQYGLKLASLLRKNNISIVDKLVVGTRISLR